MAEQPSLTNIFFRFGRFLIAAAALSGAGFVLASCAQGDKVPPPCPEVRVDSATAEFTKFREGVGRAAGDVEYRAELVGFKGSCKVSVDKYVEIIMDADFVVTPGAAVKGGDQPIYFFVAVPQFFPQTVGKQIFGITYQPSGKQTEPQKIHVDDLRVKIPLKKDQSAASYDIYLGLQLTPDQLEFNRVQAAAATPR